MRSLALLSVVLLLTAESHAAERVWARVKAYCPCEKCCEKPKWHPDYGFTATGKKIVGVEMPDQWGIAAAWGWAPPGTRIVVPGYKPSAFWPANHAWPVDDSGRAVRRAWRRGAVHIEVRFIHHQNAIDWGVKWCWIIVYRRK